MGGPAHLSQQELFLGMNDPVGMNRSNETFDPAAFTIFDAWASHRSSSDATAEARRAIARGQALFNSKPFTLSGVAGLSGRFAIGFTAHEGGPRRVSAGAVGLLNSS